jgi:hypothetical protein
MNAIMAQSKNCPLGVNTTIEVKNVATTSDNTGTILVELYPARGHYYKMRLFLSSIVVLTSNGQFLGCATIAFSERFMHSVRSLASK